jgi:hypothetical protein
MVRRTLALVAAALLLAGCTDETPAESEESLAAQQERVLAEMEEAVAAVDDAGLEVVEATGGAEYCQMPPDPGATYRAGGKVAEGDDPAAQVATIRDALVDLGWSLERDGADPEPYATLTRGDLRAGVSVSRRVDEPGVTFGITAPCLSVNDDYDLPPDNLEVNLLPGG